MENLTTNEKPKFNGAIKKAFPLTVPVLTGYAFLGMAFGMLLESKGYNAVWAFFMALTCYSGSMQYIGANLLASPFNPLFTCVMTLAVNARHLFYGISLLDKYNHIGKTKPFLMFSLTDETYSIVTGTEVPPGINRAGYFFWISLFDFIYWVTACTLGAILGSLIPIELKGLDFVLTALFIVILIEKLQDKKNIIPSIVGIVCTALSIIFLNEYLFLIVAMVAMMTVLFVLRPTLDDEKRKNTTSDSEQGGQE
ncbi:MAG: AzlC family ABC transporter permease [Clostridia bacterium]|nr:AzlC family ABC transporter permease [Clostridia bacterium]